MLTVLPALIKKTAYGDSTTNFRVHWRLFGYLQEFFRPINDRLWITRYLSTRPSLNSLPASGWPTPAWLTAI
jgi:hypothetical protein